MKSISFSIARVNRLRRDAEWARDLSGVPREPLSPRDPSGEWHASAYDANDLIRVFDTLRLKAGFTLHAYVYEDEASSKGIIWAVPVPASSVAPKAGSGLMDRRLPFTLPRPLGAVPLMQAIEGDGSPWSYLSASILRREAAEFGAEWHGQFWTCAKILSKPPRQADEPLHAHPGRSRDRIGEAPPSDWEWDSPVPQAWKPTYVEQGSTKRVVLHIYSPVGAERIYRAADTYPAGSYDCTTENRVLCTGREEFEL
ncbi:MAG: hypothetical protein OXD30_02070 [Bryobacterales bacterium]|nr:hypothetical protein [Bryobacterales bacterium]